MTRHGPYPDALDERTRVLADAAGALAVHVDDGGFCRGCITTRGRLVALSCAHLARAVQASLADPGGAGRAPTRVAGRYCHRRGGIRFLGGRRWATTRRIGRSDIARLNAVTTLYRSLDYEFGGGMLVADVGCFAESASALLDLRYSNAPEPSLLSSVAAARQLAGWTAFDAGHADAQRHLLSAERTAVAANDVLLAARVRYCQARQFQHLRHNRDALDTLRLARNHLGVAATPAVTAMLHGAEAASLAALGERESALRSLGDARDAFDRVNADHEPEWMRFTTRQRCSPSTGASTATSPVQTLGTGPPPCSGCVRPSPRSGPRTYAAAYSTRLGCAAPSFSPARTRHRAAGPHPRSPRNRVAVRLPDPAGTDC